jgi:hypothetical protein
LFGSSQVGLVSEEVEVGSGVCEQEASIRVQHKALIFLIMDSFYC